MALTWSEAVAFGAGALALFLVERVARAIGQRRNARQAVCAHLKVETWELLPLITVSLDGVQLFAGASSVLVDAVKDSDPAYSFICLGEMTPSQTLEVTLADVTVPVSVPPGPGHTLIVDVAADHTVSGYFLENMLREQAE